MIRIHVHGMRGTGLTIISWCITRFLQAAGYEVELRDEPHDGEIQPRVDVPVSIDDAFEGALQTKKYVNDSKIIVEVLPRPRFVRTTKDVP